jgi:hypothetical protein
VPWSVPSDASRQGAGLFRSLTASCGMPPVQVQRATRIFACGVKPAADPSNRAVSAPRPWPRRARDSPRPRRRRSATGGASARLSQNCIHRARSRRGEHRTAPRVGLRFGRRAIVTISRGVRQVTTFARTVSDARTSIAVIWLITAVRYLVAERYAGSAVPNVAWFLDGQTVAGPRGTGSAEASRNGLSF